MRKMLLVTIFVALTAGCSGGGGPSESQIKDSLESRFRGEMQDQIDMLVSLQGERGRKEALSMWGVSDTSEITVTSFSAEDIRELENGDYSAKVVYVRRVGDHENKKATDRVKMTEVEGEWKIIGIESL